MFSSARLTISRLMNLLTIRRRHQSTVLSSRGWMCLPILSLLLLVGAARAWADTAPDVQAWLKFGDRVWMEGDGALYSASVDGGELGGGAIVRSIDGGATWQLVYSFDPAFASRPVGAPVEGRDGYLYGATDLGRRSFVTEVILNESVQVPRYLPGVIFRVGVDGSGFQVLGQIPGESGSDEALRGKGLVGELVESVREGEPVMLGVLRSGGQDGAGCVVAVAQDGSGMWIEGSFAVGERPAGGLAAGGASGVFHGITSNGGDEGKGRLYRFEMGAQGGVSTVHSFGASLSTPAYTPVWESADRLLVLAEAGGAGAQGGILRLTLGERGAAEELLHTFTAAQGLPVGPMTLADDGAVYVATRGTATTQNSGSVLQVQATTGRAVEVRLFSSAGASADNPLPLFPRGRIIRRPDGALVGAFQAKTHGNGGGLYVITPQWRLENRYEIRSVTGTWTNSHLAAIELGGHLLTLGNAAEHESMTRQLGAALSQNGSLWIGAYADPGWQLASDWKWVTGEPWGFTLWSGSEPDNSGGNERHAHFHPGGATWNDIPASSLYRSLVEFEDAAAIPFGASISMVDPLQGSPSAWVESGPGPVQGGVSRGIGGHRGVFRPGRLPASLPLYAETPVAGNSLVVQFTADAEGLVPSKEMELTVQGVAPEGITVSAYPADSTSGIQAEFGEGTTARSIQDLLYRLTARRLHGTNQNLYARVALLEGEGSRALIAAAQPLEVRDLSPSVGNPGAQRIVLSAGTWEPVGGNREIELEIADDYTSTENLEVAATSDNLTLLPTVDGLIVSPPSGDSGWRLRIQPAAQTLGSATIDLLVRDSAGNTASTRFTLEVVGAPRLSGITVPRVVPTGSAVRLEAVAQGSGTLAFQWFRDGEAIPGATAATYEVPSAIGSLTGTYKVRASNGIGVWESQEFLLEVMDLPVVASVSSNIWVLPGQPFSLDATWSSAGASTVQWRRDGVAVVSTNSAYTVQSAGFDDEGWYQIEVKNAVGTAVAGPIFVRVQQSGGEVFGWGSNNSGEIRFGAEWTDVVDVVAGGDFTVGITASGRVVSSGNIPAPPNLPGSVVSLAAGQRHVVALLGNGTVRAWGTDPAGAAVQIPQGLANVVQVVAGDDFTAALRSSGEVIVFGAGQSSSLGPIATRTNGFGADLAALNLRPLISEPIRQLAAGPRLLGGIDRKGRLVVLAGSVAGLTPFPFSTPPETLTPIQGLAFGDRHAVAIGGPERTGIVVWGNDSHGQLQLPEGLPERFQSIQAGLHHTLVLGTGQVIAAWGAGSDPASSQWPNLSQSVVPSGVIAHRIAAGRTHSVALGRRPVPPTISRHPVSQQVLVGSEVLLEVVAAGDPELSYVWQRRGADGSWLDVPNATERTLTLDAVRTADDGAYQVVVSNPYGQATSEAATVEALVPPSLPEGHTTQSIARGLGAEGISLEAPDIGGSGPFQYQWFLDGELIPGAIEPTYAAGAETGAAGVYGVRVTGSGGEATFEIARVRIIQPPTILTPPSSGSAVLGDGFEFSVIAEGEGSLQYRWLRIGAEDQRTQVGASEHVVPDGNKLTFTSAATADAGQYEVEVVGDGGAARSPAFAFRVIEPPQIFGTPVLQKLDGKEWAAWDPLEPLPVGSVVRMLVDAVGTDPLSFQWFHNLQVVVGASGPMLQLAPIDEEGSQQGDYQVRVVNESGEALAVISTKLVLTTQTRPRLLSMDDQPRTLKPGATLEVDSLAVGQGLTYQWTRNGEPIEGADGPRLVVPEMQSGLAGNYALNITNQWGAVASRPISVQVEGIPPTISQTTYRIADGAPVPVENGAEITVPVGKAISIAVTAVDPGAAVVWYRDGAVISSATGSTLSLPAVNEGEFGQYWATVSTLEGVATSERLEVHPAKPPVITLHPRDANVVEGSEVSLSVVASSEPGSGEISYQWYQNSEPIPGANHPMLDRVIVPSQFGLIEQQQAQTSNKWYRPSEGGMRFYVEVTNEGGRVRSGIATVLVVEDFDQLSTSGDTNTIQTIVLRPGWNAVHLKVQPASPGLASVLQGVPWSSVWRYQNRRNAVQFIEDVSESDWENPDWLVGFAPVTPEGEPNPLLFAGNLKLFTRDHAYLIRVQGTNDHTLYLQGSVGPANAPWVSDSYNLRGFAVDSSDTSPSVSSEAANAGVANGVATSSSITLKELIRHESALWDGTSGQPWGVYRLAQSGVWEKMLADSPIDANQAYWVYVRGAAEAPVPLGVELDFGDSLHFDSNVDSRELTVSNPTDEARRVRISLGPPGEVVAPVAIRGDDEENYVAPEAPEQQEDVTPDFGLQSPLFLFVATDSGFEEVPLEENGTFLLSGRGARTLTLHVKRSMVPVEGWKNTLSISDGLITERVAVQVDPRRTFGASPVPEAQAEPLRRSATLAAPQPRINSRGLWLGRIRIDGVSQVNGYEVIRTPRTFINAEGVRTNVVEVSYRAREGETEPTVTPATMEVDMLVHYDGVNTRLVSEVFFMKEPASGDVPGNFVLFCNRSLMGRYEGVQTRDREQVGRRVSSVAFPLPSSDRGRGFTAVAGLFEPGSELGVSLSMDADDPLNPFKHRYHPDHDNLSADFRTAKAESYSFRRDITLNLAPGSPSQDARLGTEVMEGTFVEKIYSLHRNPIVLKGRVEWLRISSIENLISE